VTVEVFNVGDSEWLTDRRTFYVETRLYSDSAQFNYSEPYQLSVTDDSHAAPVHLTTLTAATHSPTPTDVCYYIVGMSSR